MREPHAADTLAGNLANPMAPVFYSISTLHCLTVSLAHGGAGIGAAGRGPDLDQAEIVVVVAGGQEHHWPLPEVAPGYLLEAEHS